MAAVVVVAGVMEVGGTAAGTEVADLNGGTARRKVTGCLLGTSHKDVLGCKWGWVKMGSTGGQGY